MVLIIVTLFPPKDSLVSFVQYSPEITITIFRIGKNKRQQQMMLRIEKHSSFKIAKTFTVKADLKAEDLLKLLTGHKFILPILNWKSMLTYLFF